MDTLKIVVDEAIPYIKGEIEKITSNVVYLSGNDMHADVVHDADVLIVRTRTRCDANLLEGSRVKLIVTATIGVDHIDTDYCQMHNIKWTNCPGCNAGGVIQYIQASMALLQLLEGVDLQGMTLGVVGVGHVGSAVAQMASREYGMQLLLCDPPRAEVEDPTAFVSFEEILQRSDVITFHTPLIRGGKYPTYHMFSQEAVDMLERVPIIINTSRGEVVHTAALKRAIEESKVRYPILDVWESEPHIDKQLLENTFIGTAHIAGYSADGKSNATRMSLEAVTSYLHKDIEWAIHAPSPKQPIIHAIHRMDATLQIYNPMRDSKCLKKNVGQFEKLRANYPIRLEESNYSIEFE